MKILKICVVVILLQGLALAAMIFLVPSPEVSRQVTKTPSLRDALKAEEALRATPEEAAFLWAISQVEAWPGDENRPGKAGELGPYQISRIVLAEYREWLGDPTATADFNCALWHL